MQSLNSLELPPQGKAKVTLTLTKNQRGWLKPIKYGISASWLLSLLVLSYCAEWRVSEELLGVLALKRWLGAAKRACPQHTWNSNHEATFSRMERILNIEHTLIHSFFLSFSLSFTRMRAHALTHVLSCYIMVKKNKPARPKQNFSGSVLCKRKELEDREAWDVVRTPNASNKFKVILHLACVSF